VCVERGERGGKLASTSYPLMCVLLLPIIATIVFLPRVNLSLYIIPIASTSFIGFQSLQKVLI